MFELMQFDLIQATTPEHIEQARILFLEYANSLGFSLCFQNFDDEMKNLPGAYGRPDGKLLLAKCTDHVAGCVALRKLQDGICEMKRLYVRPLDRGKGLGEVLVKRVIVEARSMGYACMRLDTIEPAMKEAVALYRRIGFVDIAPYSKIPQEGAVWLELRLDLEPERS